MKKILIGVLVFFVIACKEEIEEFHPYSYDGEYPVSMTGNPIATYIPQKLGGEMDVFFNGHSWNHGPYLSLYAYTIDSSRTDNGQAQFAVDISPLLTNEPIGACILETLYFRIPMATGRFTFAKGLTPKGEIKAQFYSLDCDAGKDTYIVDSSSNSWVNIKRYNTTSQVLEAEFNISFLIKERNYQFGPIYPTHVNLRGSLKTVARVFK